MAAPAYHQENSFMFPNGKVVAFYGTAASCEKCVLDQMDYNAATGPLAVPAEAAKWALSPQSGTIIDRTPTRNAVGTAGPNQGLYAGYYSG